jgi:archaellum component FlaF (FlaF/FlaG flagellin family)
MYTNYQLCNTFVSTATNYVSTGASSTLSTLSFTNNGNVVFPGGQGALIMGGTISSGTVSLMSVDPIGNTVSVVSLSTNGSTLFTLPQATILASFNATTASGRTVAINAQLIPTNLN